MHRFSELLVLTLIAVSLLGCGSKPKGPPPGINDPKVNAEREELLQQLVQKKAEADAEEEKAKAKPAFVVRLRDGKAMVLDHEYQLRGWKGQSVGIELYSPRGPDTAFEVYLEDGEKYRSSGFVLVTIPFDELRRMTASSNGDKDASSAFELIGGVTLNGNLRDNGLIGTQTTDGLKQTVKIKEENLAEVVLDQNKPDRIARVRERSGKTWNLTNLRADTNDKSIGVGESIVSTIDVATDVQVVTNIEAKEIQRIAFPADSDAGAVEVTMISGKVFKGELHHGLFIDGNLQYGKAGVISADLFIRPEKSSICSEIIRPNSHGHFATESSTLSWDWPKSKATSTPPLTPSSERPVAPRVAPKSPETPTAPAIPATPIAPKTRSRAIDYEVIEQTKRSTSTITKVRLKNIDRDVPSQDELRNLVAKIEKGGADYAVWFYLPAMSPDRPAWAIASADSNEKIEVRIYDSRRPK